MNAGRNAAALFLALTCLFCHERSFELAGSRSAALGRAELMSEYRQVPSSGREVALLHVLFVPTFDVPASEDYLVSTASTGTVDRYSLECNFTWGNRSIRSARNCRMTRSFSA